MKCCLYITTQYDGNKLNVTIDYALSDLKVEVGIEEVSEQASACNV